MTACYCNSIPGPLRPRIRFAVATVIKMQPILSAIPVDEGTKSPYFARLNSVDLEKCIDFVERENFYNGGYIDPELDGLIAAQHNKPFEYLDGTCPFWRLQILLNPEDEKSFTACFVYHHSLGDGASGKAFHKSFLSSISDTDFVPLSSTIVPSFGGPILPALETLHPLPLSFMTIVKELYNSIFTSASQGLWSGASITAPLVSQFRSLSIPLETTSQFLAACRREGATITTTLQSLMAASLFNCIPEFYSELTCAVPVSLRRWLPPPISEDSMGVWIASVEELYLRCDFSWGETRRSRQKITDFLARYGRDTNVALLRWLSDYKSHFTSKLGTKRGMSFEISNVGTWFSGENASLGGWKVGRMLFSQSASVTGAAIGVCVISGGDGSMTLGYTWQEGVVDGRTIEQIMEEMQNRIEIVSGVAGAQMTTTEADEISPPKESNRCP